MGFFCEFLGNVFVFHHVHSAPQIIVFDTFPHLNPIRYSHFCPPHAVTPPYQEWVELPPLVEWLPPSQKPPTAAVHVAIDNEAPDRRQQPPPANKWVTVLHVSRIAVCLLFFALFIGLLVMSRY